MSELSAKQCVPCRGGVAPLKGSELAQLHGQLRDWEVVDEHHLTKRFEFPDFVQALAWVNQIGELAEQQDGPLRVRGSRAESIRARCRRCRGYRANLLRAAKPSCRRSRCPLS